MKKLKTGALATLIACAMAACLGLVACSSGPTDEEVIKEGIASELDPIKNLDDATLDEILSEAGSEFAMLESMGIDSKTLVKSYLDGFDYTIDSVEVDGDSAKATLTATCKSFTDASAKAEELAEAWGEQMTDEQLASMTQDDITAKIGEITMQAIDETQAIDMPLVLTFTKNDNEWTPDADVLGSLLNLFE